MRRRHRRRPARAALLLALFAAACAAGISLMWSVADPRFTPPPVSPSGWTEWAGARDPLDALAAVARVATTAAVGLLAAMCAAHLVACLWGSVPLRRWTERLVPTGLAGLVAAAALGSGSVVGAADSPPTPGGVTMHLADGVTMQVVADDPPVMTAVDEPGPAASAPATLSRPRRPDVDVPAPVHVEPTSDLTVEPTLHLTVEPGDHLWGIAERRLRLTGIGEPSEDEVRAYWLGLIAANTDRLADPRNPDLVLPGQELVLPG